MPDCRSCPHLREQRRTDFYPPGREFTCTHETAQRLPHTEKEFPPFVGFVAVAPVWCPIARQSPHQKG